MIRLKTCLLPIVVLAGALPARAGSSASSAVSDSVATSVGSVSDSFGRSSDSSTHGDKTAAGDYRIVDLAAAPERPGAVRLKLQAVANEGADGELLLIVPQATADQSHLAAGQILTARPRPYGVEFARSGDRQPFFLVLDDDWYRELQTHVVKL